MPSPANYILMLCVFITYQFLAYGDIKRGKKEIGSLQFKGGFKSEEAGGFLHCQDKYSKSLSWAENLNFPPKTVNKLFKFSTQDSDLEYLSWQCKKSPVSSDFKPPLVTLPKFSFPFEIPCVIEFDTSSINSSVIHLHNYFCRVRL